eukprot:269757_1
MNKFNGKALHVFQRAPLTIEYYANDIPKLAELQSILSSTGHIRLRGLTFSSAKELENRYGYLIGKPMNYKGGTNARNNLSNNVFNVGNEPPSIHLDQHNEMSYTDKWPQYFMLACINNTLPNNQGITTICNTKLLTEYLPKDLYNKFYELGIKHIRRESDLYNQYISKNSKKYYKCWQDSFMTENKDDIEQQCILNGYMYKWENDNSLCYEYVRPAFMKHPLNSDIVIFNNFLSGIQWFNDWEPFCNLEGKYRPFWNQWGNGQEFSIHEINTMNDLYNEFMMGDCWRNGDVLLLDNQYTSHGRTPYSTNDGNRKITVMMGTCVVRSNFNTNGIGLCQFET